MQYACRDQLKPALSPKPHETQGLACTWIDLYLLARRASKPCVSALMVSKGKCRFKHSYKLNIPHLGVGLT